MASADNTTQTTYFTYGADGQRVRKVFDTNANLIKERIYLGGGYEIYRERILTPTPAVQLERHTLHVNDDAGRIAMVETKTISGGAAVSPANLFRFQYTNHLGSAHVECDQNGAVISFEELHPYGTSAYRSTPSSTEVSARRYRYTGKERDEETGLDYFGARYYAPWLGRWTSADPLGLQAGLNLYLYGRASPVVMVDPNGLYDVVGAAQSAAAPYVEAGKAAWASARQTASTGAMDLSAESLQAAFDKAFPKPEWVPMSEEAVFFAEALSPEGQMAFMRDNLQQAADRKVQAVVDAEREADARSRAASEAGRQHAAYHWARGEVFAAVDAVVEGMKGPGYEGELGGPRLPDSPSETWVLVNGPDGPRMVQDLGMVGSVAPVGPKLPLDRAARAARIAPRPTSGKNSPILRRNMKREGVTFAPGEEAGHLVASTGSEGRWAAAARGRELLTRYNIGVNDAANGIPAGQPLHGATHTEMFHLAVEERLFGLEASMKQAGFGAKAIRGALRRELRTIGRALR